MGKEIKRSRTKKAPSLSLGESFTLERKRLGYSQKKMAKELDLTLHFYKLLEYDLYKKKNLVSIVNPSNILPNELCFILRRRAKLSQEAMAEKLGVTRYWLGQIELGKADCGKLLTWWENETNRSSDRIS